LSRIKTLNCLRVRGISPVVVADALVSCRKVRW